MEQELNMSVSPVCVKDGEKFAYVSFTDGTRSAEGKIPDCKIVTNDGFSREEAEQLETYMALELSRLKKMAASIRLFDVFTK